MILHHPPAEHERTIRKTVFLSGLSDPRSCALSPVQIAFLRSITAAPDETIFLNFPYLAQFGESRDLPSLLSASLANGAQFLRASGAPYRSAATPHWDALVDACEELTVITLSCGLEILNSCLVSGRRPGKIQVISLGPVARSRPLIPHVIIRGSRDYFSQAFFNRVDHILPGVGHLNYLQTPLATEIIRDLLINRS